MSPQRPGLHQPPEHRTIFAVGNLHLVQLEEIPGLLRWIELSEHAGYMSEDEAGSWYIKIGAWQLWLELNQDQGH